MSQSRRQSMFRELRVYERALHKKDIHFTYLDKMPLVHLHVHMHIYIYMFIYLHAFSYDVTCKKGRNYFGGLLRGANVERDLQR